MWGGCRIFRALCGYMFYVWPVLMGGRSCPQCGFMYGGHEKGFLLWLGECNYVLLGNDASVITLLALKPWLICGFMMFRGVLTGIVRPLSYRFSVVSKALRVHLLPI